MLSETSQSEVKEKENRNVDNTRVSQTRNSSVIATVEATFDELFKEVQEQSIP